MACSLTGMVYAIFGEILICLETKLAATTPVDRLCVICLTLGASGDCRSSTLCGGGQRLSRDSPRYLTDAADTQQNALQLFLRHRRHSLSRESHDASASSVNTGIILPSIKIRQPLSCAGRSASNTRRSCSSSAWGRSCKLCSSSSTTTGLAPVSPAGRDDILCLAPSLPIACKVQVAP